MAVARSTKFWAFLVVSLITLIVLGGGYSVAVAYAQGQGDDAALQSATIAAQAEGDVTINSPANNAKHETGKKLEIKTSSDYISVGRVRNNYLYYKGIKDGEQVFYESDTYLTSIGGRNKTHTTSYTFPEEGLYTIEVCRDTTYNGNTHVNLAPEDFVADASVTIIVQKNISGAEITGLENLVYTGRAQVQDPVVTIGGKTLDPDTDYDVTCTNNVNVGEATLTVTGKGFYKGTASAKFNITPADISEAAVSGIVEKTYTGSAIMQTPSVTWNGFLLNPGTDYELVYADNTDVGAATVEIQGRGNFTGSSEQGFAIGKASIRNASGPTIVDKTYTGSALTQNLSLQFGGRALVEDADYTATYANNVNPGTATITIAGKGNFKDSMTRTFSIREVSEAPTGDVVILSPEDGSTYATGSTIPLRVKVNKFELPQYNGTPITGVPNFVYARVFRNGNPYETVNRQYTSAGVELTLSVPAEDAGVYEIQACWITWTFQAVQEDGRIALNYVQPGFWDFDPSDSITAYVGVSAPATNNISGATVTGLSATKEYTGNSITQNPTVKLGNKTLAQGTDYYITYKSLTYGSNPSNNVDIGSVEMTIHGKGNYKGSYTSTFTIVPKQVTASMITLRPASFNYSGELQKPGVTVMNGSVLLVESDDYTLVNAGGTEPGSYAVEVTGKGNYTGTASKNFAINKWSIANAIVTCDPASYTFDGQAKEPSVNAMLDGKVIPAEDYDVSYANNTAAGTATVTITAKSDSYYTGSVTGQFPIAQLHIATDAISVAPLGAVTYNRAPQMPEPQVMMGESVLRKGADYSLSYENNTNVGQAKITITGAGNFKGTRTVPFTIGQKDIGDASITVDPVQYQRYADGAPITPSITVKDGSDVLTEEEYSVEYANNIEVGTANITLTGIGNYTGSRSGIEFQILDRDEYAVTALADTVAAVEQEGTDQYLDADKLAVQEALDAAKALLADEGATTADLEQALENLDAAVGTAKKNAAKKALDDAVNAIEREGTSQYLDADRQALQTALDAAKALLADESATVDQLEGALANVMAAQQAAKEHLAKAQEEAAQAQAAAEYEKARKEALTMPSAEVVTKAILAQTTDKDPAGSAFAPLMLKSAKQTNKANVLKWTKVPGAAYYVVFGNKCGKSSKIQKLATVKTNAFTHKKLKKGTYYKYVVIAVKNTVIGERAAAVSKMIHVATKGGKVGNAKKLTIKAKVGKRVKAVKAATVKKGKSLKLSIVVKPVSKRLAVKKHVRTRFESSNVKVATVSAKGVIKGVGKGSCYVYAYAQNGVVAKVKVTTA